MHSQQRTKRTKRRLEMPNPVIHWEITGKDAPKLQQFYADLFGWNVDSNNPMNYTAWWTPRRRTE